MRERVDVRRRELETAAHVRAVAGLADARALARQPQAGDRLDALHGGGLPPAHGGGGEDGEGG